MSQHEHQLRGRERTHEVRIHRKAPRGENAHGRNALLDLWPDGLDQTHEVGKRQSNAAKAFLHLVEHFLVEISLHGFTPVTSQSVSSITSSAPNSPHRGTMSSSIVRRCSCDSL